MAKIYSALMTPFDSNQEIDEKGLEQSINYQIAKGADGFYITGSTAECFMMSLEERKRIMKLAAEINNGRADLIAHVGAISQKQATELAKYAAECGYKRVSSVVPYYYDFTFENVKGFFESISKESGLPIFVYNIPATTGKSFTLGQLYDFLSSDYVCGIKHTSMDFYALERMKNEFPNKTFFGGRDECFLSALVIGADGMIGSTANIIPHIYKKIAENFDKGDLKTALKYQDIANRTIEYLQSMEFNVGMKYILEHYGVAAGHARKPFGQQLREQDIQLINEKIIPMIEQ